MGLQLQRQNCSIPPPIVGCLYEPAKKIQNPFCSLFKKVLQDLVTTYSPLAKYRSLTAMTIHKSYIKHEHGNIRGAHLSVKFQTTNTRPRQPHPPTRAQNKKKRKRKENNRGKKHCNTTLSLSLSLSLSPVKNTYK